MSTHILLLRGVMPSGRNRVPMAELRVALGEAGLADVRTYIQSGNVVARSPLAGHEVGRLAEATIAGKIGADITVIVRTPAQLCAALANNPFSPEDAARTYFTFLAAEPQPDLLAEFERTDFAPDTVMTIGQTLYTRYATRHSDSKFTTNFFERKLKLSATTRNFNTLSRLIEMSA